VEAVKHLFTADTLVVIYTILPTTLVYTFKINILYYRVTNYIHMFLCVCVNVYQIIVHAGLISHRVPCFGYIVKEVDKAGPLLEDECKKRGLHFSLFPDLKVI
jgi:hypothetical protein